MNKVILKGRLGKDPELRTLDGGSVITSFSVATGKRYTNKTTGEVQEQTQWHNCIAWNKTGEFIAQYFQKGQEILLEGEIEYTTSESNGQKYYYTNIVVRNLEFCGSKPTNIEEQRVQAAAKQTSEPVGPIDDLPF